MRGPKGWGVWTPDRQQSSAAGCPTALSTERPDAGTRSFRNPAASVLDAPRGKGPGKTLLESVLKARSVRANIIAQPGEHRAERFPPFGLRPVPRRHRRAQGFEDPQLPSMPRHLRPGRGPTRDAPANVPAARASPMRSDAARPIRTHRFGSLPTGQTCGAFRTPIPGRTQCAVRSQVTQGCQWLLSNPLGAQFRRSPIPTQIAPSIWRGAHRSRPSPASAPSWVRLRSAF